VQRRQTCSSPRETLDRCVLLARTRTAASASNTGIIVNSQEVEEGGLPESTHC